MNKTKTTKEFSLSEKIRKRNNFEELDVSDVKEVIRRLKEVIDCYLLNTCLEDIYGLRLKQEIDKLAGEKLKLKNKQK